MILFSVKKNGRTYTVEKITTDRTVLRINHRPEIQSMKNIGPTGLYYDEIADAVSKESQSVCILGLAGATIARRLKETGYQGKITGVESDETMIEIAAKYFDLDSVHEIILQDARKFCRFTKRKFDCVIVDLYINGSQKVKVSPERLVNKGGKIIYNNFPYQGIEVVCM